MMLVQDSLLSVLALVLCIIIVCLVAHAVAFTSERVDILGGAPRRRVGLMPSAHLVVDTLNLAHWLRRGGPGQGAAPLSAAEIVRAIDRTAAPLKKRFSGTLTYILKDQETVLNDAAVRAAYQAAAERNRVHIACAERSDFAAASNHSARSHAEPHSARGRDDFYMCLQARRYRCAVASEDRLRDFAEFRGEIAPFHTLTFVYWRATPERDFIRPASPAYAQLRRPRLLRFEDLGI